DAARNGAVEPADKLAMGRLGGLGVPGVDRLAEAPHERLRGRAPAEVLLPLSRGLANALLLLLDVRHSVKVPAARGPGDGSNPSPYAAIVDEGEQQRRERRLERDRRRRERGEPTYFETEAAIEAWPVTGDPADVSTAIIPREQLEAFREAEPESERAQRGLA